MNMSKRIISLLAALSIGISGVGAFPSGTFGSFDIKVDAKTIRGGVCGDNVIWEFDSDGTLTFSGTGEMAEEKTLDKYDSEWKGFKYVGEIKKVVIEEGITNIVDHAFSFCESLKSVSIPKSVTKIGSCSFNYCTDLESIVIPEGVTTIEIFAFSNCSSLKNISVPKSVKNFGEEVFEDTPFLEAKRAEDPLVIINNILIDGKTAKGNIVIPNGVTAINRAAFKKNSELTGVTIPNSVKNIDSDTFLHCENMKTITIPASITSIPIYSMGYHQEYVYQEYAGRLFRTTDIFKTEDFTIKGYNGTVAEEYAKGNGFKFVSLGNAPGDLNGNGTSDVDDLVLMQKITAGWKVDDKYTSAADLDGDKDVDVDDLVLMQKKIAGWKV